jgi:RHS repeat-associated protein
MINAPTSSRSLLGALPRLRSVWSVALALLGLASVRAPALRAQTGSMRVTMTSPTAASLGKFGDVPVNLATGVADISVPIFTVKGRTLELPIVARYHPSGIRVEDVGGWLGIGWALDAGGTITRTVRGLVDEASNGYYSSGHVFQRAWWPTPPVSLLDSLRDEQVDGEPDQFFFSFAGRSGQFVMGPTSTSTTIKDMRTIPHQKLRIVPTIVSGNITAFSIQTEDGTRYTFGAVETNTDVSAISGGGPIPDHVNETHNSAWQLTKIAAPGGDVITLGYTPYTSTFKIGGYQEKFDQIVTSPPGSACVASEYKQDRGWQVVTQRLTTITSAQHAVTFVPGATLRADALSPTGVAQEPRLDTIRVATPAGAVIRRFQFAHDYSTGRLTLRSIFERDGSNANSLPPYSFDYNATTLPAYSSLSQDHWGFYNARANTTLIPPAVTPSGAALAGGDRSPDSVAVKAGTLTRITYPTGGTSEFVYEANDYGSAGDSPGGIFDGVAHSISADSPTGSTGPVNTPFTVTGTSTVLATVTVFLRPTTCGGAGCRYAAILGKGMWTTSGTFSVSLPPGSYTAQASDEWGGVGNNAFISVAWSDSVAVKRKIGGGLRLAELRTTDAMGTTRYRKFKYTLQSDPTKSSGIVIAEPRYSFQYNGATCQYFSRSTQSATPLGGGPLVGYREVRVWEGSTAQYGLTVHYFRSVADINDDPVNLPLTKWPYYKRTSREWKRGQETQAITYSSTAVAQQRAAHAFAFRDEPTEDTVTTRHFRGMSQHYFSSGIYGSTRSYNPFETVSAWTYTIADSTTVYDTLGANPVTRIAEYTHGNSKHLQRTQTIETNSDGTQRITNARYPADYATGAGNPEAVALTAMQDTANMHAALVERWVLKRVSGVDSVVKGDLTSYKLFGAGTLQYLPSQRFSFNNPGPLAAGSFAVSAVTGGSFTKDSRYLAEETAATVDAYGRVTALTDARGKSTTYGYGGNANSAFLTQITRVHDASGPVNLVTDIGYGADGNISSITDEGRTNRFFTWDGFGRLSRISNHGSTLIKAYGYTYSRTSPSWTFNSASPNTVSDTTVLQVGTTVVTTQVLDGLGREIQRIVQDGTNYHVTAQQYDDAGRAWRTWKPYSRATAGYDASFATNATSFYNTYLGQSLAKPYVETLYRPDPLERVATTVPEYVGASPTVSVLQGYGVDAANKRYIRETTDESGKKTRTQADHFGNPVTSILGYGAAEATTTTFTPDVLGQRQKVTDPRGLLIAYGRTTRGLLASRTSPDAGTVSTKYDKGRNPRFSQDANQVAAGTVAFTSYDFANRPLTSGVGTTTFATLDPDAAPTALETTNTNWLTVRAYDAKPSTASFPWSRFTTQLSALTLTNVTGRLTAVASKSNGAWQLTVFSYDTDGRIVKRYLYTEANGGASVLTNLNTTVTYTRDLRDSVTLRQVTTGASSWYQWYDYDTRGLLWKVSAATTSTKPGTPDVTYTYRPSGVLASRLFSGGTSVPLVYTIREQLAKIGDPATTTYPFSAGYSYNANGTISTGDFYSAGSPAANKRYKYDFPTYDALNRLKAATYASWNGTSFTSTLAYNLAGITYDNSGNLLTLQRYRETATLIDNLTYTIAGTSNRLTTLADAVGVSAETWDAEAGSFTYDANGNQLTAPAPYNITHTTYDPQNLPLSLTSGGTTTTYRYNELGQRIAKQVGAGNTEVYLLEGRTPLGVFTVSGAGAVVSSYFNLLADTRVVGRQPSAGSRSYYHTDLLGSTRAVVQGATVAESYDYDPWGVLMPARSLGSGTKEKFTTKERDAESQLDYFGARSYASAIARWTTVDPPVAADSTPQWNPYGYVKGNPVNYSDPLGLCPIDKPLCNWIEATSIAIGSIGGFVGGGGAAVLTGVGVVASPVTAIQGAALGAAAGLVVGKAVTGALFNESADGASGGGGEDGAQDKRLSPGEIRKLQKGDVDIHELKAEALGTRRNLSRFDLFKSRNGDIVVKPKDGSGTGEPTGLNIKDF